MKPNILNIREVIYSLKRDYGVRGTFIKIIREETNSVSGQRSVEQKIVDINKIVVLPENLARKFWYDVGFLKANTNFTYGGEVSVVTKNILIENKDLNALTITDRDFFVLDFIRWHIEKVTELEFNLGYIVTLKTAPDSSPYNIININTFNTIQLYGVCVNVP